MVAAQGSPLLAPRSAEGSMDPYGALLQERIVILGGEVTDFSADAVISQLLLLDSQDPKKDIKLFINSPGGSVSAGMGIYDCMQLCRADISTYCFGLAASMGAFLLGAGKKGKRYSMPNALIMIHQPLCGASGQAIDVEIQVWHRNPCIVLVWFTNKCAQGASPVKLEQQRLVVLTTQAALQLVFCFWCMYVDSLFLALCRQGR